MVALPNLSIIQELSTDRIQLIYHKMVALSNLNFMQGLFTDRFQHNCHKMVALIILKIHTTGSSIYIGPLVQFLKFLSPFQKNFKTNDTSIERTNKGLLHLWKKVSMAPSWGWTCSLNWKSITFTKTCLEPSMTKIFAVSKVLSNNG